MINKTVEYDDETIQHLIFCSAFVAVGGYENLVSEFFNATADNRSHSDPTDLESPLCGEVPKDSMHLFREATPGVSDLPWTGVVFGLSISSIWYWCSDQVWTIFEKNYNIQKLN